MKYLKRYKIFENHEDIHAICKKYEISNYIINEDGSIDVNGDVGLVSRGLTKLPLRFKNVSGGFHCHLNQLTSLDGAPQSVGGVFYCHLNQLTSLEGAPQSVGGNFHCYNNQLTSLYGAPRSVGAGFFCDKNQLISLEGSPQIIGGDFNCNNNELISLEGAPQSIGGSFYCYSNPVYNIWILFEDYSKIELFNDYDCLREIDGKPTVILDRLNDFLQEIGKQRVEKVKGYISI